MRERKLDELLAVTKENNRMLRGTRTRGRIKAIVIATLVIAVAGYGYHLFQKHQLKIIEFQQAVEELQESIRDARESGKKIVETVDAIGEIFEGAGERQDPEKDE